MFTCASVEPDSVPVSAMAAPAVDAELHCSRSERSSLEVVFEQVSRPLSVAVGLQIDEAELSETGRLGLDKPSSMNGTPPENTGSSHTALHQRPESQALLTDGCESIITTARPTREVVVERAGLAWFHLTGGTTDHVPRRPRRTFLFLPFR